MRRGVRLVLLSATFLQFLDVSVVNVAAPAIKDDLDAPAGATELVGSCYTLAFACTLITAGRLGDRHGYRRLYGIGVAVFTAASGLCALSPDIVTLIAARMLQGLGAGLMAPQVLSIIQVAVPPQQRGRVFGSYGSIIGIATVSGPLLGGLLIETDVAGLGWRWVFLVNLPVGAAALWRLHLLPAVRGDRHDTPDFIGVVLAVLGLAMFVYPLAVGRQNGWPVWAVGILCAAPGMLGVLVLHQLVRGLSGRVPLLRLGLLRGRRFRVGLLVVGAFFSGVPPFFFLLSVYLQAGFGHSAWTAGLAQLPFAAATAAGSLGAGRITAWMGGDVLPWATGLLAASMLCMMGMVLVSGPAARPWELAVPMTVGGLCFGIFTATAFPEILAKVPRDAAGSASGMLATVQQAAGSVGLAVGSLVFHVGMPEAPHGAPGAREAYARGFAQTLAYEVFVFLLACAGTLCLQRRTRPRRPPVRLKGMHPAASPGAAPPQTARPDWPPPPAHELPVPLLPPRDSMRR